MPAPLFIGDEPSAAGWRLAGARVMVPDPGAESRSVLTALGGEAELVLLSSVTARALPPALLERFLLSLKPLTLVVGDVAEAVPVPDLAARVRARLGMSA